MRGAGCRNKSRQNGGLLGNKPIICSERINMLFAPNISAIFNRRLGKETRLGLEKLCLELEKMGLRIRAPPFPDLQLPLRGLNDTFTMGKA